MPKGCIFLLCALFPATPTALIGNSVPFCYHMPYSLSESPFLRKDLIKSFTLRPEWLVMPMALFPQALLSFGISCRQLVMALVEEDMNFSFISSVVLRW